MGSQKLELIVCEVVEWSRERWDAKEHNAECWNWQEMVAVKDDSQTIDITWECYVSQIKTQ